MVKRDELINFINDCFGREFRANAKRKDNYVNGVQIRGRSEVNTVALGVSASLDFLKLCRKSGADLVIIHHGIGLDGLDHHISPLLKNRLRELIDGDMTLLAFHYMLDAHPVFGNNAQIIEKAGARIVAPFHDDWGFVGELPSPLTLDSVIATLSRVFGSEPTLFRNGPKRVRRIGTVSGGGAPRMSNVAEIIDSGVDLYVTGEAKEEIPAISKEININYAAFGHYNTEKFGVTALGDLIKKQYPALDVRFIDVPCAL